MSTLIHSFPPIASPTATVLVLGSMPGVASLKAKQYYAHPRNAFWPIMGELFGAGPSLPYDDRCERLREAGVAVWDVLYACQRAGSLDTAIDLESERPNALAEFFTDHPDIWLVAFNGHKAEKAFQRYVGPLLSAELTHRLRLIRLPSTSPAHAGRSLPEKLQVWRETLVR